MTPKDKSLFPEVGIYTDIDINTYHADRHIVSSTGLKKAKQSSRHFAWYLAHGTEEKSCFDFGNFFEVYLLDKVNGTNEISKVAAIFDPTKRPEPDKTFASTKNKEWKVAWEIENAGKYVVNSEGNESLQTCKYMVDAVMAEPTIVRLLENLKYQVSMVWRDEKTGVLCKTRPDLALSDKRIIVDIKTTKSAGKDGFTRECVNYDYFLSAAMQMRGAVESGFMDEVSAYFFLAVEKSEPYNACLYEFPKEDWGIVNSEYDFYLQRAASAIVELQESGGDIYKVSGYSENAMNKHGIVELGLPPYYIK